jgi:hypothetical protein
VTALEHLMKGVLKKVERFKRQAGSPAEETSP